MLPDRHKERERPVEASHHSAVFRNRQPETHTLTSKKSWRILNRVILSVSSSSRWHGATSEKMSLLAGPIRRRLPKYQVSSSFVRSPQMIRSGEASTFLGLVWSWRLEQLTPVQCEYD
ncbi:uncharacterized protein LOC119771150 [Culex quinquefasciatus]|uniref:uncharacterized protein LOC119771150 n=1 Tax=Culex quinquefasciatus TaxID=7176 RepID=UPI0018E2FE33|nr:uncharacterized protein LOC119771150 [Culex quinquefasciatus]